MATRVRDPLGEEPPIDHHPRFSPSSGFPRAALCPGSATLVPKLRAEGILFEEESEAAREGTLLHRLVRPGESLEELDDEQREAVEKARAYLREHTLGARRVYFELPLSLRLGAVPLTWGTADVVAVYRDHAVVIDFKFGRGEPQVEYHSGQGSCYAAMALQLFRVREVEVHVYHPRLGIEYFRTFDDVGAVLHRIRRVMARADTQPRTYIPSPSACAYCPAKAHCPAACERAFELAGETPEYSREPAVLGALLERAKLAGETAKAIEAQIRRIAFTEGVVPEGYLVRERRGARKVAKPALLYERLRDAAQERTEGGAGLDVADFLGAGNWSLEAARKVSRLTQKEFFEVAGDAIREGKGYKILSRVKE